MVAAASPVLKAAKTLATKAQRVKPSLKPHPLPRTPRIPPEAAEAITAVIAAVATSVAVAEDPITAAVTSPKVAKRAAETTPIVLIAEVTVAEATSAVTAAATEVAETSAETVAAMAADIAAEAASVETPKAKKVVAAAEAATTS